MKFRLLATLLLVTVAGCKLAPNYVKHVHNEYGEFWYYKQRVPTNVSGICAAIEGPGKNVHWAVDIVADGTQTVVHSLEEAKKLAESKCPTGGI